MQGLNKLSFSPGFNTFNTIQAVPFVSNRFALKRFLGLTDDEVAENERFWAEENGKGKPTPTDSSGELRGVGVSQAGIEADAGAAADTEAPPGMEMPGALPGAAPAAPGPVPTAPAA